MLDRQAIHPLLIEEGVFLQNFDKAETCIVDSEISEVEYFMYDDDENFSKVLVKDGTAYVFDKDGQIVNIFSGFILKYNNQKG